MLGTLLPLEFGQHATPKVHTRPIHSHEGLEEAETRPRPQGQGQGQEAGHSAGTRALAEPQGDTARLAALEAVTGPAPAASLSRAGLFVCF